MVRLTSLAIVGSPIRGKISNYLLHYLVLFDHGDVLQGLCLCARLDELLVHVALLLTGSFRQFALSVDLVGQVHAQKVLLLLLSIHIALNLVERFFWTEMWLVIKFLNDLFLLLPPLLFLNLVANEVDVVFVLLLLAVFLGTLNTVHVLHSRVELSLLLLAHSLHSLNFLVESIDGQLIDVSNLVVGIEAFVS